MSHDSTDWEQVRQPQFSLRTLLLFTTGVSLFLGLGYWVGWLRVSGLLLEGTEWAQFVLIFWPVVIAELWLLNANAKTCGRCVLAMGGLFLVHLAAMHHQVKFELRAAATCAFGISAWLDGVVTTLNWTVPSVAVGLAVALYLALTVRTTLIYLIGCLLATIGLVGFLWFAPWLAARLPGLSDSVWWL